MPIETKRKRKPKDYFIDWVFHDSASQQLYRGDGLIISGAIGAGFWTGSGQGISRESDILITGSLIVSGTEGHISASAVSASTYFGDGGNLTGIVAGQGLWTASNGNATRESNVEISGSLLVSSSISGSEINWDGAAETLTSFSSSIASRVDAEEAESGGSQWTASGTGISRESDVTVSGTLFVSLSLSASEVDWDGAEETLTSFSSSTSTRLTTNESNISTHETRLDNIDTSGSTGLGFWSGSGIGISRESVVQITGSLLIRSGSFVGIGTENPGKQLHIFGSSSNAVLKINSTAGGGGNSVDLSHDGVLPSRLAFSNTAGTFKWAWEHLINDDLRLINANSVELIRFLQSPDKALQLTASLRVSGSGRVGDEQGSYIIDTAVGIGFANPQANLDVSGSTIFGKNSTASLHVFTGSIEALSALGGTIPALIISSSGDLFVSGTVSASAFIGDGSGLTNIPGATAFWTESGTGISRLSDVTVSGTLFVSLSLSASEVDWDGASENLTSFSSSIATRMDAEEAESGGSQWTASGTGISRFSDVLITGSLIVSGSTKLGDLLTEQHELTGSVDITGSFNVNGTASVAEIIWDGASENLSSFSSSAEVRITANEVIGAGSFWTGSGAIITRESDVQITGSVIVSNVGSDLPVIDSTTLLVVANTGSAAGISIIGANDGNSILNFGDLADENIFNLDYDHIANRLDMKLGGAKLITFSALNDGRLGIGAGASAPGAKLDISGSIATDILLRVRDSSGSDAFIIDSSDNVGIGTATPSTLFDVFGPTRFGSILNNTHDFTGSVGITGSLNVNGTASVGELNWDGAAETLTSFSSSIATRMDAEEAESGGSQWTASGTGISRFSDVTVSGTLFVSLSLSASEVDWDGSAENLTSFSSSAGSRITTLEGNPSSFWTASGVVITRESDVLISGSLLVSSSISASEINWDGASETLTSFSSSTSTRLTTNESNISTHETRLDNIDTSGSTGLGFWSGSGTGVSRFSDVTVSGSLFVSSSISGSEINWDGSSETLTSFSSSIASRMITEESEISLWTASGDFIRRQSDVEITGTLNISSTISASGYDGFITSIPILLSGSFNDRLIPAIDIPESMSFTEVRYALETGSTFVHIEISQSVSGSLATGSIITQAPFGTLARISESVEQNAAIIVKITGSLSGEHLSLNLRFRRRS